MLYEKTIFPNEVVPHSHLSSWPFAKILSYAFCIRECYTLLFHLLRVTSTFCSKKFNHFLVELLGFYKNISMPFVGDPISVLYTLVLAFCKHMILLPSQSPAGIPRAPITCQNLLVEARKKKKEKKRKRKE